MIKYIPNALSILRLTFAFVQIPYVLHGYFGVAFGIFIVAAISDFLDGYVARKFSASSDLGRMLDPLADKVIMTVSYLLFSYLNIISWFVTVIVIARDILILLIYILCRLKNIELIIEPIMSSKINTTVQLLCIVVVLACKAFVLNIAYVIELMSFMVVMTTIYSGVEYACKYRWIKEKLLK